MFCINNDVSVLLELFLVLIVLLLLVILLLNLSLSLFLLTLGSLWITFLLAWTDSAPLGQLGLGSLLPFSQLLLPAGLQPFRSDDLSTTLIQLLSVAVRSGVCPTLVFGEHANSGGMGTTEGLGIETLLDGLISKLQFFPFIQLFEFIILIYPSLYIIVFVGLKFNNCVPDGVGLGAELVRVHGLQRQRLKSDT